MVDWQSENPTPTGPESAAPSLYAETPSAFGERFAGQVQQYSPIEKLGRLSNYGAATLQGPLGAELRGQRGESDTGAQDAPVGAALLDRATPVSPMMDPTEYNKKYAPQGTTLGDKPMPESVAQDLGAQKFADIQRDDIIRRNESQHNWATNFSTSTVAFMTDPTNIVATFLPGIGEENVMAAAGRLGITGLTARIGARAVAGASGGALGMVPLTGAEMLASNLTGANDYDLRSAFRDMMMGAATGALIHSGIMGTAREVGVKFGWMNPDEAQRFSMSQNPLVKADAMKTAVAQVAEGKPVDVQPVFDIAAARDAETELRTWTAQRQRIAAEGDATLTEAMKGDSAVATLEQKSQAALDTLNNLKQEHAGFTADIAAAQQRLEALRTDTTAARVSAIDAELARSDIPAARRDELQSERTLVVSGSEMTPEKVALETSRAESEIEGLTAGHDRLGNKIASLEKTTPVLQQAAETAGKATTSALRIKAERVESRERIVNAMAARTIRRYAGHLGVELKAGEADVLAKRLLSGEAETKDALAELRARVKGPAVAEPHANIDAMVAEHAGNLQSAAQRAMMDATLKEKQLAREGYAMGMPQDELVQAREDVYGPKPDEAGAGAPGPAKAAAKRPLRDQHYKAGAGGSDTGEAGAGGASAAAEADPEMTQADQVVADMAENLSAEERGMLEVADAEIQRAGSLREAFAQAAECLIGAGV